MAWTPLGSILNNISATCSWIIAEAQRLGITAIFGDFPEELYPLGRE